MFAAKVTTDTLDPCYEQDVIKNICLRCLNSFNRMFCIWLKKNMLFLGFGRLFVWIPLNKKCPNWWFPLHRLITSLLPGVCVCVCVCMCVCVCTVTSAKTGEQSCSQRKMASLTIVGRILICKMSIGGAQLCSVCVFVRWVKLYNLSLRPVDLYYRESIN